MNPATFLSTLLLATMLLFGQGFGPGTARAEAIDTRGQYDPLLNRLCRTESGCQYKPVTPSGDGCNANGYCGKYQMGSAILSDIGMVTGPADAIAGNDWSRLNWTPKANNLGVNSIADFINNPAAQELSGRDMMDKYKAQLQANGAWSKIGTTLADGTVVTEDGLLATSLLVGAGGANAYVNGDYDRRDGNGTLASSYMRSYGTAGQVATSGLPGAGDPLAGGAPIGSGQYKCRFCGLFQRLDEIGNGKPNVNGVEQAAPIVRVMGQNVQDPRGGFGRAVYLRFIDGTRVLARVLALGGMIVFLAKFLFGPPQAKDLLEKSFGNLTKLCLLAFFLTFDGMSFLYTYVFDLLQQIGLASGTKIIKTAIEYNLSQPLTPVFADGALIRPNSYPYLWSHVEQVGFRTIDIAWERLMSGKVLSVETWAWGLLSMPYMFVVGIFGAFMVQTQFYFIAIATFAPILLLLLIWPQTKAMVWAALRFLLGGSMTIVFAAVAMGFTGMVQVEYFGVLQARMEARSMESMADSSLYTCNAAATGDLMTGNVDFEKAEACREQHASDIASGTKRIFATAEARQLVGTDWGKSPIRTDAYWMMFLLGFISALLHLAAPRIASNISGANDSATSAAAVVGAMQVMGTKLINVTSKASGWGMHKAGEAGGSMIRQAGGTAIEGVGQYLRSFSDRFRPAAGGD